ncbi:MAG: WD40/YVTN/BNR-like repeat-containing protein [Polyangiales bacterium]
MGLFFVGCETADSGVPVDDSGGPEVSTDSTLDDATVDTDLGDGSPDTSAETGLGDTSGADAGDASVADTIVVPPDASSCGDAADASDAAPTWPTWQDLGRPAPIFDGRLTAGGDALLFANELAAVRWSATTWKDAVPYYGLDARYNVLWGRETRGRPAAYRKTPTGVLVMVGGSNDLLTSDGTTDWAKSGSCATCVRAPVTTSSGAMISWRIESSAYHLIRAASFADTWTTVAGPTASTDPPAIVASGARVLVGDQLSIDDGKSFAALPTAPFAVADRALGTSSVCAFGAAGGVARIGASGGWSTSSSASGFTLAKPAAGAHVWDARGDRVFALGTTSSGPRLARSLDGCATWSFLTLPAAVVDLAVTATGVVLTDGTDVWTSTDDGATFVATPRPNSASIAGVDGRVTSCGLELVVSTGLDRTGIYTRVGDGSWSRLPAPETVKDCGPSDCAHPTFGVWLGPHGDLFRDVAGFDGKLWSLFGSGGWTSTPFKGEPDVLSFHGDFVLGGISYATDGGHTFSTLPSDRAAIGFDGSGVAWSYDGTTRDVYSSTDLVTWTATGGTVPSPANVRVSKSGKLYVLDSVAKTGQVSTDGGKTWAPIATPTYSFLAIGDGILYSTTATGLRISWDGGLTSSDVSGLPSEPGFVGAAGGKIIANVDSTFDHPRAGLYLLEPKP